MEEKRKTRIRIYFIRHGETEGNLEKKYVGRTDEPLSPAGMENMKQLRERMWLFRKISGENSLKNRKECEGRSSVRSRSDMVREDKWAEKTKDRSSCDFCDSIPKLYISPMRRCRESAAVLFPAAEKLCSSAAVECQEISDFRECDFGAFEYHNYRELMQDKKLAPLYQAWIDSDGKLPFPGGETVDGFKKRCVRAFDEVMARNENEKNILFLVHGGTIMAILEARGEPKKEYYDYQVPCGDGYVCDYLPERGAITKIERLSEQIRSIPENC